ncbi:MAG: alkaline phosphatase family protein, partial [Planctomycetota bacterium]
MPTRKVMIIGLDAVTLELIRPWAEEGRLPNLARFLDEGASGPLRSTLPPGSPAAWSTFATGMNPGGHGVLGFYQLHADSYEPRLMNASSRAGTTFWEVAGQHGVRGGVLNLPFTFPPRP